MELVPIKSRITCTDDNIICVINFEDDNGDCVKVNPKYEVETGHSTKWRWSRHLGTITNPSQGCIFAQNKYF